jgi:Ca2+-binding RTX toxin-like protein
MATLTATYTASMAAEHSLNTSSNPDQGMGLEGQSSVLATRIERAAPYFSSVIVTPDLVQLSATDGVDIFYRGHFDSAFATNSLSAFFSQISGTVTSEYQNVGAVSRYVLTDLSMPASTLGTYLWSDLFRGNDALIGGVGNDDLYSYTGNDTIEAGTGFDRIWAGSGDDYAQGGYNGDQIYGEEGNDDLRGGNGLDLIVGGLGNDTIRGAKGTDTLTGGEGADVFIFEKEADGTINIDTITDYTVGTDQIQLSASVFKVFSNKVGQTVGLSQNLIYDQSTGALSYDADGSGSAPALEFAIIGTASHPSLANDHFAIIA